MGVIRTKHKHLYVPSLDRTRRESINRARGYEDFYNVETEIDCELEPLHETEEKVDKPNQVAAELELAKKEMRKVCHEYRQQIDMLTASNKKLVKKLTNLESQLVTAKMKNKNLGNKISRNQKDVNSQSEYGVPSSGSAPVGRASLPNVASTQTQSGREVFPPLPREN